MWYIKGVRTREANIGIAQDKFLKQPLLLPVSYFFLPFFVYHVEKSTAKNCTSREINVVWGVWNYLSFALLHSSSSSFSLSLFCHLLLSSLLYLSFLFHLHTHTHFFWLHSFSHLLPLFNSFAFRIFSLTDWTQAMGMRSPFKYMHIYRLAE